MNKICALILTGILITQNCKSQFLDRSAMDTSVKPGDNFWLYANGNWNKTAVIPNTENSTGSFFDLRKKSREAMQSLCETAAASKAPVGSIEQKVGDMY